MALVLAGTGALLYAGLGRDLSRALDDDLRLRAQDLSTIAGGRQRSLATEPGTRLIERGETFAQLLTPDGAVLDETGRLGGRSLLSASQRRAALAHAEFSALPHIPGLDEGVRLLASPLRRDQRRLILVVGATAENRREALRSLRNELLIAGPAALLLATTLGYLLAGAGLRTVEAMRIRAARISAATPHERLPVPPTGDELQRLGLTLNAMLARLQDALERERSFVADASHELRTPLALMRAELDYALHYAETEHELRAAIRTASDETDRLVALAGALLLIAASDHGQLALRREPTDAGDLIDSVRQRFAWRAQGLGRPLVAERPDAPIAIDADRVRLEQALGNLVDNALRHGAGTVRIAASRAGQEVQLRVSDDGPGFAPDLLPRAFERFSRGEAQRAGDGSGLGLAIVRTIAEAHGGTVEAAMPGGPQARVVLRLPGTSSASTRSGLRPST
jgi:signal transduction histidine kinase